MYTPPFHRRVLPWIFAIVFLAAAPVVVFYTAGYRWNPKKEKVERNGTLIMNSTPSGAAIIINGQPTGETTPTTQQNVPPGRTVIRYEKTGYTSWQKALDIIPERVTFANAVWLWKIREPTIAIDRPTFRLAAAPNGREFASLISASPTTDLVIWSANEEPRTFAIPIPPDPRLTVSWAPDGRALLIEDPTSPNAAGWMVSLRANQKPTKLPHGRYRWMGSDIQGVNGTRLLTIRGTNGQTRLTPLPPSTVDLLADFSLRRATSTDQLVLFSERDPLRGIILPSGAWTFDRIIGEYVILRDNMQWISINPREEQPRVHRAVGRLLPPEVNHGDLAFLLINDGELWRWNPTSDPELLLREGNPLMGAAWHKSGENIAIATNGTVTMLNTDPRDGRLRTALATFDDVSDVILMKEFVYIAGRMDEQRGVWELEIE